MDRGIGCWNTLLHIRYIHDLHDRLQPRNQLHISRGYPTRRCFEHCFSGHDAAKRADRTTRASYASHIVQERISQRCASRGRLACTAHCSTQRRTCVRCDANEALPTSMGDDTHARLDRHNGQKPSGLVPTTPTQPLQAEDSKWGVQVGGCGIRHGKEVSARQSRSTTGDFGRKAVLNSARVALHYFGVLARYPRTYIFLASSRSAYIVFLMSFYLHILY
jgi:hypothetical protein